MAVINGVDYSLASRLIPQDGLLVSLAEHLAPEFIQSWEQAHPSIWRDRIPKGTFQLFSGYSQKVYIYRGTLGQQAGLTEWDLIEPSRKASATDDGNDRCTYTPSTYTWAYEAVDFAGVQTSWRSPAFCVNDLKFQDKAQMQLGMIIRGASQVTDSIKETFNREVWLKQAADNNKFILLAEGVGLDFIDGTAGRVTYNPYSATTITFASTWFNKISTLSFSMLDLIKQYLQDQCPDAAIGNDGGMPVYGLMCDLLDFEKFVLEDAQLREDFRRAIPQRLIDGFNMGFRLYRGWALMHDARQARFEPTQYGATITCARVNPRRATRAGIIGLVPETNPDYITATLGTAVVFLSNVLQILVPSTVNSLGSGMTFGPAPDFNGQWQWLNIPHLETNPMSENGFFFSRYEYFVKPLEYAQDAIVLLYRRCTQTLRTGCAVEAQDSAELGPVAMTVIPVAADFSSANRLVTLTLADVLDAALGDQVTINTNDGDDFTAYITEDSKAPIYTFGWLSGATNAPAAVTELDDPAIVTVTVA